MKDNFVRPWSDHCRVVSDDCYPYMSGEMKKTGLCMVPRFKMFSNRVKCPSSKRESSSVYKTSPPYRIAPNVRHLFSNWVFFAKQGISVQPSPWIAQRPSSRIVILGLPTAGKQFIFWKIAMVLLALPVLSRQPHGFQNISRENFSSNVPWIYPSLINQSRTICG